MNEPSEAPILHSRERLRAPKTETKTWGLEPLCAAEIQTHDEGASKESKVG